ncbi:hypothetical protein N7467_002468 [Penicillium canescens]|nr:hypothetical protein N7467_002468 [Penicillium canescens]
MGRTLFNNGWFMEYFVPEEKPYMRYMPEEFPINLRDWNYYVRGTGDEPQAWTCGRDVAKPVAELLAADEWEPITYDAGSAGHETNVLSRQNFLEFGLPVYIEDDV